MSRKDDEVREDRLREKRLRVECDLTVRRTLALLNTSQDITVEGFTRGLIVATGTLLHMVESQTDPSCPGCAENAWKYAMSIFGGAIRIGADVRKKKSEGN